uniref:Uncharacterized protein n=1 Tax=Solanum lycopersicum TaxID=4081 RepID=K4CEC5_SOLLC
MEMGKTIQGIALVLVQPMQWFREIERCTTRGSNNILFIMVPEWRNAHYIQSVDSNATKAVLDLESTYNVRISVSINFETKFIR